MAFTGRPTRRAFLGAAAAPFALAALPSRAAEYGSAGEVFTALDALQSQVEARLGAVGAAVPSSAAFVASARADHARLRAERARLRTRLGLRQSGPSPSPAAVDASLAGLRASQEALVHAYAEGLPALGDAAAVERLAGHLVDLARHLAVIDLWIEMEEQRG